MLDLIVPRNGTRRGRLHGYEVTFDLSDLIQRSAYFGSFEVAETKEVKAALRAGDVFVDVGANFGYYTALGARAVGQGGRVLAFEPSAQVYTHLTDMVDRNQMRQVTCVNAGLSDHPGFLDLYIPPAEFGNHDPSTVEYCPGMSKVQMRIERLDTELERRNVHSVALLKLDVEGHELKVLRGAESHLKAGRIRTILCELHPTLAKMAGHTCNDICTLLFSCGFRSRSDLSGLDQRVLNVMFSYTG